MSNQSFAAILAGGIGKRIGSEKPKQFIKINNKPILAHSIEKYVAVDELDKIIVSSPKDYMDETKAVVDEFFPDESRIVVIEGGVERRDTIMNSINYVRDNDYDLDSVMVTHDAARIFATPQMIKDSIKYAREYGAASAVVPAKDVIFESKTQNKLDGVPLRKYLFHAQTPQAFNILKYLEIYNKLTDEEIEKLDEAMVLFNFRDEFVYLFEGDPSNFKITTPFDIKLAESMFED